MARIRPPRRTGYAPMASRSASLSMPATGLPDVYGTADRDLTSFQNQPTNPATAGAFPAAPALRTPAGPPAPAPAAPASGPTMRQQAEETAFGHVNDYIAAPPGAPVPAASPGAPQTTSFQRGVGNAVSGIGKSISSNPLGAVNAALGVTGLIMNASAKPPTLPGFRPFRGSLRPARGLGNDVKAQLIEHINAGQRMAVQPGTDNNLNTAARLTAAANATGQREDVELRDAQALREDQDRLDNQQLQIDQQNYAGQQQREMQQFQLDDQRVQAQRATGTAMAQGALDYFAQMDATKRQQAQVVIANANEAKRARFMQLTTAISNPALPAAQRASYTTEIEALLAEGKSAPVVRAHGGTVPVFRRGGSVKTTVEVSTGGADVGHLAETMVKEFTRNVNAQARQSSANFAAAIREALRLKARPLPTSK